MIFACPKVFDRTPLSSISPRKCTRNQDPTDIAEKMKNRAQPDTEMLSTRHDLPLSVDLNINSTDIGNKWRELKLYSSLSSQPAVSIAMKNLSAGHVFCVPSFFQILNFTIIILSCWSFSPDGRERADPSESCAAMVPDTKNFNN